MSIILNQDEAERWRSAPQNQSQGILPTTQSNRTSASTTPISSRLSSVWSFVYNVPKRIFSNWTNKTSKYCRTSKTQPGSVPAGQSWKESYLCVDKCWTGIVETNMGTISSIETMSDDAEFFREAQKVLAHAQGNWIQRALSWRSYTQICLSKVVTIPKKQDG